ncbi:LytTR family transcriptional regulator DNA-binding domain-containing protein [Lederbergia galactosidilytica]|uniref:LytTR family transcriptional regulator DNA-binding domain-containing protein n=1 Tax=Lederbergia galactosidilytica TaxID=217031 RepID=UPI001EE5E8B9|nr:LytTR family transcriptional regulator DNA-binding domain-containing protein [Lederbergia galactosidilytica]
MNSYQITLIFYYDYDGQGDDVMSSILSIKNIEKQDGHTIIFPAFSLDVQKQGVLAIHTNTNVRTVLMKMFMGETPISNGKIYVNGVSIESAKKEFFAYVGFCNLNDGLYERLRVKDHYSFYRKLYHSTLTIEEGLRMTQLDIKKSEKVQQLSLSEKRRIQFGRLLFQNPLLYIFEEPDQNVDLETKRVFMKIIRNLKQQEKAILIFTSNMESALSVTNQVYRLDETGLQKLDIVSEEEENQEGNLIDEKDEEIIVQPVHFEKIPTKINDKIVLFDPPEIDYIESGQGHSLIYIKGESYPSMFTLTELEKRLQLYGFFRCHRSYIVNLQKVREVITFTRNSFSLVLMDENKSSIPLSKNKMVELKEILGLK